ncbi:MAG TPA: ArdC-like ssDNA-binding domain-containing protein [Pyrinomonadaceae bacterium]|nr:ArdC-like ssDNA-binding domain-containing protein [Pyrinomonadaceae bacterium]
MESHTKSTGDIPKWSALLVEAVNKPGLIMQAYSAFHQYSVGNQLLALVQCQMRGLEPGPINTFPGWRALGRNVKRGERALVLCMPITCKRRNVEPNDNTRSASTGNNSSTASATRNDGKGKEQHTYTAFLHKPRWFVLSQTTGEEFTPPTLPQWDAKRALKALDIEQIPFTETDGNCQGYARGRQVAINPVAQLPAKTLLHECAHVTLGHTTEADFTDTERTPKSLREVEAEAVALLCCEALNLEGADFCRGYIQNWLGPALGYNEEAIPEKSGQCLLHRAPAQFAL